MAIRYSLGLDIGETSVGWAITELDDDLLPSDLVDLGVHHFALGAKQEQTGIKTYATIRRSKRQLRKTIHRRKTRKAALLRFLSEHGFAPVGEVEQAGWLKGNPYLARKQSLDGPVSAFDVGRAIYHLSQRRGYAKDLFADEDASEKSSDKKPETKPKDPEKAKFQESLSHADEVIRSHGSIATYAFEFLGLGEGNKRGTVHHHARLRGTLLPTREAVEQEIRAIWKKQAAYEPTRYTDERLESVIGLVVDQRSYKITEERVRETAKHPFVNLRFAPSVGRCSLLRDERRCPRSSWLGQVWAMTKSIRNVRIVQKGFPDEKLSGEQQVVLLRYLLTECGYRDPQKTILKKRLGLTGKQTLNFDTEESTRLKGSELGKVLAAHLGVDRFLSVPSELLDELSLLLPVEKNEKEEKRRLIADVLERIGANDADGALAERLIAMQVPSGYLRFSARAIRILQPYIDSDTSIDEYLAIEAAKKDGELPKYPHFVLDRVPKIRGDVANPVVRRALEEMRNLVNAVLDEYGKPDRIVLELGRELKRTLEQRQDYQLTQFKNEKERLEAIARLGTDSGGAIRRYRLWLQQQLDQKKFKDKDFAGAPPELLAHWKEQKHICPYSGRVINFEDVTANDGRLQIDHILPQSKTLDDTFLNTVLCFEAENRDKGDRTPYEWLVQKKGRPDLFEALKQRVRFMNMSQDKKAQFAIEHVDEEDFTSRQMNDTRYASREARKYLERLFTEDDALRRLLVPAGGITAELRRHWRVDRLIANHHGLPTREKKLRDDLRHNALDAAVLSCVTFKALDDLKRWYKAREYDQRRDSERVNPPFAEFPDRAQHLLFHRVRPLSTPIGEVEIVGTIVSRSPDVAETGALHSEKPYGLPGGYLQSPSLDLETLRRDGAIIGPAGRFAQRIPVTKLTAKNIFEAYDPATDRMDPDKTCFCDVGVGRIIARACHERGLNEKSSADELAPVLANLHMPDVEIDGEKRPGNPIRRVRVWKPMGAPVLVRRSDSDDMIQAYATEDNFRIDIYEVIEGRKTKWVDAVVPMMDRVLSPSECGELARIRRGIPDGAQKAVTLYPRDSIFLAGIDDIRHGIYRLQQFSQDHITLREHFFGGRVAERDESISKKIERRTNSFRGRIVKVRVDLLGRVKLADD